MDKSQFMVTLKGVALYRYINMAKSERDQIIAELIHTILSEEIDLGHTEEEPATDEIVVKAVDVQLFEKELDELELGINRNSRRFYSERSSNFDSDGWRRRWGLRHQNDDVDPSDDPAEPDSND